MEKNKKIILDVLLAVSFIGMLLVNILAEALPINGLTSAQISDKFDNFFRPAGFTFFIWWAIYALQVLYILYVFGVIKKPCLSDNTRDVVSIFTIVLNVFNIGWVFAWHYEQIFISLLIIILMLVALILVSKILRKRMLAGLCKLFIYVPFLVYLAWVTIATVGNFSSWLVAIGFAGFGLAPYIWAIIAVVISTGVAVPLGIYFNCLSYVAVIIWAFVGILVRQLTTYAGDYTSLVYTTIVAIFIMTLTAVLIIYNAYKIKKFKPQPK